MRNIALKNSNLIAVVDDCDFELISRFIWYVSIVNEVPKYAKAKHTQGHTWIRMHQMVMGPPPIGMIIDHKDRNGFHNWRSNLRFVTYSQNGNNSGGGVYFDKFKNKWVSNITLEGKRKYIGFYDSKEEAIVAKNQYIIVNKIDTPLLRSSNAL